MMQKVHGCRVSTGMRGDSLPSERGAALRSKMGVLGDETLDCIPAQSVPSNAGEYRIFGLTVAFA